VRWFDSLLFMGAGKCSRADVNLLKRRLRDALLIQNYAQQGAEIKDDEREDIVRDIAAALLGKEITIGADLPYPGKLGQIRYTKSGRRVKGG